jgi:hypothetical protein
MRHDRDFGSGTAPASLEIAEVRAGDADRDDRKAAIYHLVRRGIHAPHCQNSPLTPAPLVAS